MENVEIRLKEIDDEIERLRGIISEKDSKWDYNRSWQEYEKHMAPENEQIWRLDQERRLIMPYELSDLSDYGDVMSLKDFITNCRCGSFIDYDGHGYYVKDGKETNIMIHPSDITDGRFRLDFDTIIWFNR
jgi:hypothetical protein